jgi:hypothetical protein
VPWGGQSVGVLLSLALQEAVGSHLAEIVAELGQTVPSAFRPKLVRMAGWISAVRHPEIFVPLCRSTSISRMIWVSWILMPGILVLPEVMGRASR